MREFKEILTYQIMRNIKNAYLTAKCKPENKADAESSRRYIRDKLEPIYKLIEDMERDDLKELT